MKARHIYPVFIRFLRQQPRKQLVGVSACIMLAALGEGLGLSLLLPMLTHFQQDTTTAVGGYDLPLPVLLVLFLALQGVRIGFQYLSEQQASVLQHQAVDGLRRQCFQAVVHSRWGWLAQRDNAQLANLLLTDINRTGMSLQFFLQWASGLVLLLVYSVVALSLSPGMTVLVLGVGAVLALLHRRLRRDALQLGGRMGQTSQVLHRTVQESLTGIKLVKILGNEQRHMQLFDSSLAGFRALQLRFQRDTSLSRARTQFASVLMLLLMLYAGLSWWQLPLATLATLVFIFSRLMPMALQVQQQMQQWLFQLPALQQTADLLEQCRLHAESPVDNTVASLRQALTLQEVSYHYPGRTQPALQGVSFSIPAGSTVAVIGSSGAGKSTLADVLMGLLAPDTGRVLLDGQVQDEAGRLRWRRSVAYVPQETFLFNDTIRHNLQWADDSASDAQLWTALDKAAAGFVRDLPQGLDTMVGDQGLRLSGGERQRIALARALLGRPALLILDEATSALDMANEELIRQAIVNLHGDLTVLAIGHRMATLQHADHVIVLEQGKVIAQGRWETLQPAVALASMA